MERWKTVSEASLGRVTNSYQLDREGLIGEACPHQLTKNRDTLTPLGSKLVILIINFDNR